LSFRGFYFGLSGVIVLIYSIGKNGPFKNHLINGAKGKGIWEKSDFKDKKGPRVKIVASGGSPIGGGL